MNSNGRKISELEDKVEQLTQQLAAYQTHQNASARQDAERRLLELPEIAGAEFSAVGAGVRYSGRPDVMLARLAGGTRFAGLFTRSTTRAAPVLDCERKLRAAAAGSDADELAILVNSGNANAFTGEAGQKSVAAVVRAVSEQFGLTEQRVLTASTGVIGEPLNTGRITRSLGDLQERLSSSGLRDAARAILTTDTFPKSAHAEIECGGGHIAIAGIAKGSGMIAPDMATMLAFIFTDAKISQPLLQSLSAEAVRDTFNAVTVDGDTSTNDTVIIAATGKSGLPEIREADAVCGNFAGALRSVMDSLAEQIVLDGEGATKLVRIHISGAVSDEDAMTVAKAVANSPLVKTAIAGEDPNWGRLVAAIGKSGAQLDCGRLSIWIGDHLVAEQGSVASGYSEAAAAAHMRRAEIAIRADLGTGGGRARVRTCDLTHGYVAINADYRS